MPEPVVAVVGSGPAGLMAAHAASEAGIRVCLYEKRPSAGRKLLIAGSSGLNVTYDAPLLEFDRFYAAAPGRMKPLLEGFPPHAWLAFIERLGIRTFKGTSRRWFIEGMKAPPLLNSWLQALRERHVEIVYQKECEGFEVVDGGVELKFTDTTRVRHKAAALCFGGGSWETPQASASILNVFQDRGLACSLFRPTNVGFQVDWPPALLADVEGSPIKNVVLSSPRGQRAGDLVITAYGLEGTPVYFVGAVGEVRVDLKPDLTREQVHRKLLAVKENLAPVRRLKRCLRLGEAALALFHHMAPLDRLRDVDALTAYVKSFPIALRGRQPLQESISSAGGLCWSEVDEGLMLHRFPGVFVAGEVLDWDAPTGGFLIQACVSQGYAAGRGMSRYLRGV